MTRTLRENPNISAAVLAAIISGGGAGAVWQSKADVAYVDRQIDGLRKEIYAARLDDLSSRIDSAAMQQCIDFDRARSLEIRGWKNEYYTLGGRPYAVPPCSELIE
jgi:hypothetical protein